MPVNVSDPDDTRPLTRLEQANIIATAAERVMADHLGALVHAQVDRNMHGVVLSAVQSLHPRILHREIEEAVRRIVGDRIHITIDPPKENPDGR